MNTRKTTKQITTGRRMLTWIVPIVLLYTPISSGQVRIYYVDGPDNTRIPPGNATKGTTTCWFQIVGAPPVVTWIEINLDIVHTWTEDLEITLTHLPTGRSAQLFFHRGSVPDFANFDDTFFDDAAARRIRDGTPPFAGSFQPEQMLSTFVGIDPNGRWDLVIKDIYYGDYGALYKLPTDQRFESRRDPLSGTFLLIHCPIRITQHPTDQIVCEGDQVTFSVVAEGIPPPNYQWRKDGVDIPGAINRTYIIDPVEPDDAGQYDVVVTNLCGQVTSEPATLDILGGIIMNIDNGIPPPEDGHLDVDLDEFGSVSGWTPDGVHNDRFNPPGLGDLLPEIHFTAGLFLFVGNTHRELLSASSEWQHMPEAESPCEPFEDDDSLSTCVTAPNIATDTNDDGIPDTLVSEFTVTGDGVDLLFERTQSVRAPGCGAAQLMQIYDITNQGDEPISIKLVRTADVDLTWEGDDTNDVVGVADSGGNDTSVYVREPGHVRQSVALSSPESNAYYAAKRGEDPPGDPQGDPPFGRATIDNSCALWENYGIPESWMNYAAGVGYNVDGESDPDISGDAALGLGFDLSLGVQESRIIQIVTTYGRGFPDDCNANEVPDGCELNSLSGLLVSSKETDSVLAYHGISGQFVREFASPGEGGLDYPNGITVDDNGDVYVSSVVTDSVIKFSGQTERPILEFSGGGLDEPVGTVIRESSTLLVASFATDSVVEFDLQTAEPIGHFVEPGSGGLDGADALLWTEDGNLLAISQRTDQVLEFDGQDGSFVRIAAEGCSMDIPAGLLFDENGNLLVSSLGTDAVIKFAPDGSCLGEFVLSGSGGIDGAQGMAWGPNGNLFVCSRWTDEILEYNRADGSFVGVFVTAADGGLQEPTHLAFASLDNDCNGNGVPDDCDIANGTSEDANGNGIPDECEGLGDCDGDGDVDLSDWQQFLNCATGPDGEPLTPECECADADGDGDVDFGDFVVFQVVFTGSS